MVTKAMLNDLVEAGIPGPIECLVEMIWAALEPDRMARQAKDEKIGELKHRLDDQEGRLQNQRKSIENKNAEILHLHDRLGEKNVCLDSLEEEVKNLTAALEETKRNCEAWRRFAMPGEVQDDDVLDDPLTRGEMKALDHLEEQAAETMRTMFAPSPKTVRRSLYIPPVIIDCFDDIITIGRSS